MNASPAPAADAPAPSGDGHLARAKSRTRRADALVPTGPSLPPFPSVTAILDDHPEWAESITRMGDSLGLAVLPEIIPDDVWAEWEKLAQDLAAGYATDERNLEVWWREGWMNTFRPSASYLARYPSALGAADPAPAPGAESIPALPAGAT